MNPTFQPGDRVQLGPGGMLGTVAEPPDPEELAPGFLWIIWDDGEKSWALGDSLETIP